MAFIEKQIESIKLSWEGAPFAKTIYNKSSDKWKIYWMRGNLKWYPYDPKHIVDTFNEFL